MGRYHVPIPAQIGLLLSLLLLPGGTGRAQTSGVLKDVTIQAEERRQQDRVKPPLKLAIQENAPMKMVLITEEEPKFRMPSEIVHSTAYVAGIANSRFVAVPSTQWIIAPSKGETVHTFHPLRELKKSVPAETLAKKKNATWKFVVVDASGANFRTFRGKGLPPQTIKFDGKDDSGKWISVGQVYTAVLTYTETKGRSHTALSPAFSLAGLRVPVPGGERISLAKATLFDTFQGTLRVSRSGQSILRETAFLIQRLFPSLSIEVSSHLSRNARTERAGELCSRFLAERLLLSNEKVKTSFHPGTSYLEERVDVLVLNR